MNLSVLQGMLAPYLKAPPGSAAPDATRDFDTAAQQASPDVLSQGIGEALNSDHTPPFPQMLRELWGRGNPIQRARILNQLVRAIGPAVLGSVAGGRLREVLKPQSTGATPEVTPEQASNIDPADVEHVAKEAQARDPGIVGSISSVLAQHPDLVKGLGGAALTIALGQIARRLQH